MIGTLNRKVRDPIHEGGVQAARGPEAEVAVPHRYSGMASQTRSLARRMLEAGADWEAITRTTGLGPEDLQD